MIEIEEHLQVEKDSKENLVQSNFILVFLGMLSNSNQGVKVTVLVQNVHNQVVSFIKQGVLFYR